MTQVIYKQGKYYRQLESFIPEGCLIWIKFQNCSYVMYVKMPNSVPIIGM